MYPVKTRGSAVHFALFCRFGKIVLATTVGLAACGVPPADTATTAEAFNQSSCPSHPDGTFTGGIGAPDNGGLTYSLQHLQDRLNYYSNVGLITPETYNNRYCGDGYVVRVNGWLDEIGDFVVAAHNNPAPLGNVSQADCEALYLAAVMYTTDSSEIISQNGTPVCSGIACSQKTITRAAGGAYSTSVDSFGLTHTYCTPPKVVFGGKTWRDGDYDFVPAGNNIVVAATYRSTVGGNITTHAMSLYTPKGQCGHVGEACCTVNSPSSGPWCEGYGRCDSGTCNACGADGIEWCGTSNNRLCFAENIQPSGSICAQCGGNGQACCHNPLYPNAPVCGKSLACQNSGSKCLPIANPPAPAPPAPMPAGPPRCNGQTATKATQQHVVQVQNSVTQCGDVVSLRADSDAEAQACARAQGWTVVTGSQMPALYTYCICSFGGTGTESVPAYSSGAADQCVNGLNLAALYAWPGACTSDETVACGNL